MFSLPRPRVTATKIYSRPCCYKKSMADLILSHKDVQISLTPSEQRRLSGLLGGGSTRDDIAEAAGASLRKLLDASADGSAPLMQDVDVLVLQHLLSESAVAVDRAALTDLLDAWKAAESSLKPAVRVAIRLIDRMLVAVLAAKNKEEFAAWFTREVAKRLTDEQGKFLASFLEELTNWTALGQADVSEHKHYLESTLKDVFDKRVLPAKGGRKTCLRRLKFAREAVQDVLFL